MRDDVNMDLKRVKQQIIALFIRQELSFEGKTYWPQTHLKWSDTLVFENENSRQQEVLRKYIIKYS